MPIKGAKSSTTKTILRPDGSSVVKTTINFGYKVVKSKVITKPDGTVVTKQGTDYPQRMAS